MGIAEDLRRAHESGSAGDHADDPLILFLEEDFRVDSDMNMTKSL